MMRGPGVGARSPRLSARFGLMSIHPAFLKDRVAHPQKEAVEDSSNEGPKREPADAAQPQVLFDSKTTTMLVSPLRNAGASALLIPPRRAGVPGALVMIARAVAFDPDETFAHLR